MDASNGPFDNDDASIDLESQTDAGSDLSSASRKRVTKPGYPGPRRVPIHMNVPERTYNQFIQAYGVEPILARSQMFHLHPHLAYQRNSLELHALKVIGRTKRIWDVGSGARRHAHYRIHCLCPYLQPGDDVRLNQAITNGNSVCKHKLQECTCEVPDVLLFVHSSYYIQYSDLKKSILASHDKVAYVVGHELPDAYGSLAYGEAEYKLALVQGRLMVDMKVKGNQHAYTHPLLPWRDGHDRDHDSMLAVTVVTRLGDTALWRVTVVPRVDNQAVDTWNRAIVEQSETGVVHVPAWDNLTKQSAAAIGLQLYNVDSLYGYGSWLFSQTTSGCIYMPRGMIETIAFELRNKPRDPASFADAKFMVDKAMRGIPMPAGEKLTAATVATALAFNVNVQNEVDLAHTATKRYSRLWKIHSTLMSLSPIKTINVWWVVVVGVLAFVLGVLAVIVWVLGSEESQRNQWLWEAFPLLGFVVSFSMFIVCFCCLKYAKWQSRKTGENWSRTLFHEETVSNITGGLTYVPRMAFPVHSALREPLVPTSGSYVQEHDPRPPKHPGKPRLGLHLEGVATSLAVPTAPRTDAEAEISAITHRMLLPPTVVQPDALKKFMDIGSRLSGKLLMNIRVTGSDTMYDEWINQSKFTLAVREKFRKAYETLVKGAVLPKIGMYHCFVKFEKMKNLTPEKVWEGLKARLINGPPDAVKVAVGPWTARLYAALLKEWDGRKCSVLYASGRTPDEIGKICDEFANIHGGWDNIVAIWDDCATYDATLENELLAKRRQVYPAVGFSEMTMAWLESTVSAGATTHGVKWELGEKIVDREEGPVKAKKLYSGEMDTNLIGTIVNAEAHESGLPDDLPHLTLVCGDDSIIFAPKSRVDQQVCADLLQHLIYLGLKPTQGVSDRRCDWEFCSKLFWLAKDRQTGRIQTVLGPKPARWLTRLGWTTNTPNGMNFPQAIFSSMNDVAHVPLLNEYTMKCWKLTAHMKRRGAEWTEMKHVSKRYDGVPENYAILEARYGICEPHLAEFTANLDAIVRLPVVIDLPWIVRASERDEE